MKAAIIFSGHMRSFDLCLPNLWWFCLRHFPDAHVFVSTVKDENSHKAALLRKHFANVTIEEVDAQPDFPDLKPWTPGRMYTHEPYAISVSPTAVLRQLWQLEKGYDLYTLSGIEADVVVRCRPDIWFHESELPYAVDVENLIWPPTAIIPKFASFGGVNDRFAILGKNAAANYFATFSKWKHMVERGCPLHPESLIKESLVGSNVIPSNYVFSTVRTNGEMRPPEIIPSDFLK